MVKIPDVILNDVVKSRQSLALSNVNTGINYARPVGNGVDYSGFAQGLQNLASGIEYGRQVDARNAQIDAQNKAIAEKQAMKIQKEKELAQIKRDKVNADAWVLGNKSQWAVNVGKILSEASNAKDPDEAQSNFYQSMDKDLSEIIKNAPNDVARQQARVYFEGQKVANLKSLAKGFATKEQQIRNNDYNNARIQRIKSVSDGELDWQTAETLNQEMHATASQFNSKAEQYMQEDSIKLRTAQFDHFMRVGDLQQADMLLKNKDYIKGLGEEITYNQKNALQRAIIKNEKLKETDPAQYAINNNIEPTIENVLAIQAEKGIAPENARILSNEQAKNLHTDLMNATDGNDFVSTVVSVKNQYGDYTKNILKYDLAKADTPKLVKYAMQLIPSDITRIEDTADAMALLYNFKDEGVLKESFIQTKKAKGDDANMTDFDAQVYEKLSDFTQGLRNSGYSESQIANAQDMALKIAQSHYVSKKDKDSAVDFAFNTMTAGTQTIATDSNGKIFVNIPDEYDAETITQGLDALKSTANIAEDYKQYIKNQYLIPTLIFGRSQEAYWSPVPSMNGKPAGMQLMYGSQNANGSMIPDADGNPIFYTYEEITKQSKKRDKLNDSDAYSKYRAGL